MIKGIKLAILKVLSVVLILSVFQVNAFSRFILNGVTASFVEQDQPVIEGYVMEGAGYFLKSHSDTLLLLNQIELSDLNGVDYVELQQLVDNALTNMLNAKAEYTSLTQIADTALYDQTVVDQLPAFGYYSFQQAKGLNNGILGQVEDYLGNGDVRGIIHKILLDTQVIIDKLVDVKSVIDTGSLPETSDLWRLNQFYSDTQLLGQYAAEVFYDITGKN